MHLQTIKTLLVEQLVKYHLRNAITNQRCFDKSTSFTTLEYQIYHSKYRISDDFNNSFI